MLKAADAGRGVIQLPGFFPREREEILQRIDRQVRGDGEHHGPGAEQSDRSKGVDWIVGQLVHRGAERVGDRDEEQRMAVRQRSRHRFRADDLAEPRLERRFAAADVFDVPVFLSHRQVVAWNENTARPFSPQLPDPLDRRRAERSVVGGFGLAREQLRAVLCGVAGEDRVALLSLEHEDEMPRSVPGRGVRLEPRHAFLLGRDGLQRGPAFQLAYVELGHRRLAPWLGHRPGELSGADDDSRLAEQDPVERVIVMRMREDDLGHVGGFQAALRELLDEALSHIEAADVHQRDVPVPADESNSAPAQAPVADHPSGEALDQDVDLVAVDLHRILHSARMLASRISLPHFSESTRIALPNCSGVLPTAVAPIVESLSDTPASCSTLTTSAWIFPTIAPGTAAGATRPNQLVSS